MGLGSSAAVAESWWKERGTRGKCERVLANDVAMTMRVLRAVGPRGR